MTVFFTGLGSAADRTLFTHRGPIVKKPIQLVGGADLLITGPRSVSVSSMPFSQSHVGKQLVISGSPSGRNDGTFYISKVMSSSTVELDNASFDWADEQATLDTLMALSNELQYRYNQHKVSISHVNQDIVNNANAGFVVDITSATILLNGLLSAFSNHLNTVFSIGGPVHIEPDLKDLPQASEAYNLPSAMLLANDLRRKMELHRQDDIVHLSRDKDSRITTPETESIVGSGPLIGPFAWIIQDPRTDQVADDPSDVVVRVGTNYSNGIPVSVDVVFGLLGAIVLTDEPVHGDVITVDYSYLSNPPTRFERLNTPEFVLNECGNNGVVGLPGHTYRARSFLLDPTSYDGTIGAPFQPLKVGWKYKGLERVYTAVLNDPNTLLLNVPGNRVAYPVFETTVEETTVRYDPTTLPDMSTDPWVSKGSGVVFLEPGGSQLTLADIDVQSGPYSNPPFYTYPLNLGFPSTVSAAFRMSAQSSQSDDLSFGSGLGFTAGSLVTAGIHNDGVVVGPGFGFTDGYTLALAGLLETTANNLSSAMSRANTLMEKFNAHLITTGVHRPNSPQDSVDVVSATDETSLIILTNRLKFLFNQHINRGTLGDGVVHLIADVFDVVYEPDASSPETAISLINILSDSFNAHRVQPGVHYVEDTVNVVGPVRQVGILIKAQFPELETSWVGSAFDWTITSTYRLYKNDDVVSLYAGGDPVPLASIKINSLPAASDVDLRIDQVQQAFFGSLSRQASSISFWNFVRVNVTPLDFDQVIDNKSVVYEPIDVPEKDPFAPWITIGQGGYDRVVSGKLILDSTSSAPVGTEDSLGLSTGAYRGFIRLEPILQNTTSSSIEFTASVGFYTFSLDNRASGVFLDDGELSVHLVFIQGVPTPSTVTGILTEPFPIVSGDTMILSIDGGLPQTLSFTYSITDAVTISNIINSQLPFAMASAVDGKVKFTNKSLGVESSIQVIGGHAVEKLGIQVGTYFGRDSNPEPRVSWFGENYPELEVSPWNMSGTQSARLFGRTLRITDSSNVDYRAYSFVDPLFLNDILSPSADWKFDFRCAVISCTPGYPIAAGSSLRPCGVLINVDEGPLGKNVELHLAQDSIGQQYINILSFDFGTSVLVSIAEMPFAWNDGKPHSYDIYTSKIANLCIVLADNTPVGTFAYSVLKTGVAGPAITFGSGSEPVANADLLSSQSIVDWSSVCVFRDSKISDPLAISRRYIGLYKGGDPSFFSSYYLHQIDWTQTHTYRIVRDPIGFVSVYVDGGIIPSISVNYNSLTLPPSDSSFLKEITNSRNSVAFGSFNPFEIDRTVWGEISYSIGKITLTERRIPSHQVTNYGNAVTSPDHLLTKNKHEHFGFGVWSGGTPSDDNMAGMDPAFTVLGEGTPPVPMTQDLDSRGGLVKVDVSVESIPSADFVNSPGFVSELEDDTVNKLEVLPFIQQLIVLTNSLVNDYNLHLTASGFAGSSFIPVHLSPDTFNQVNLPPATDLPSSILILNGLLSAYNAHVVQPTIHTLNDTYDSFWSAPATDGQTAYQLALDLFTYINRHLVRWNFGVDDVHFAPNNAIVGSIDNPSTVNAMAFTNDLKNKYNSHTNQYRVHLNNDPGRLIVVDDAVDVPSAVLISESFRAKYDKHRVATVGDSGSHVHTIHDVTNSISTIVISNFDDFLNLCFDEWNKYSAHLTNPGSHGSSVFIRLDPPDRVLYESMKFFTQPDGETGLVSPFSDDETLHMSGILMTTPHGVGITGRAFPEQAQLTGSNQEPFTILGDGILFITVDGVQTDVQFQPTDTTVALVVARINSYFTGDICFDVGDGRIVVVSPSSGPGSSISVSGYGSTSLGLEVPGMTTWTLTNGSDPNVQVSLVSVGPITALRYESNNIDTIYKTSTGLPNSPSFDFEVNFAVRIVMPTVTDLNGDTGIYAGVSGAVDRGFMIGIGFEEISGTRFVKLQNLAAADSSQGIPYGTVIYRVPFDWGDGNFHEYKIVRDAARDAVSLVIVS
jgi:hypothetical protein